VKIKNKDLLIGALFIFISYSIEATHSIEEIFIKGNEKWKLIELISDRYPSIHPLKKELITTKKNRWSQYQNNYQNEKTPGAKKENYKIIVENYKEINSLMRDLCIDMANINESLLEQFKSKIRKEWNKNIYVNSYTVSIQDFQNAKLYFYKKQYDYSLHLYNKSITTLQKLAKKTNISLK